MTHIRSRASAEHQHSSQQDPSDLVTFATKMYEHNFRAHIEPLFDATRQACRGRFIVLQRTCNIETDIVHYEPLYQCIDEDGNKKPKQFLFEIDDPPPLIARCFRGLLTDEPVPKPFASAKEKWEHAAGIVQNVDVKKKIFKKGDGFGFETVDKGGDSLYDSFARVAMTQNPEIPFHIHMLLISALRSIAAKENFEIVKADFQKHSEIGHEYLNSLDAYQRHVAELNGRFSDDVSALAIGKYVKLAGILVVNLESDQPFAHLARLPDEALDVD